MKKVKITLKPNSPGKKFYLFPSSEALYVWLCHLERGEALQVSDIEELLLEHGGFIEAELRGFEYVYEGAGKHRRLDLIRLGKAQHPKNASGLLATIHAGWVTGGMVPLRDYDDADIEVRLTQPGAEGLDLGALFNDDPPHDSVDVDMDDDEDTGDPPPDDEDY